MNLERLNNGAPVLDSHRAYGGIDGVLGVVVDKSARVKDGEATATLRFDLKSERGAEAFRKIVDGIVRNVSVGYQINETKIIEREGDGEVPLLQVVRSTPFEISPVPIGADDAAGFRGLRQPEGAGHPLPIPEPAKREEPTMSTENIDLDAVRQEAADKAHADAVAAERARVQKINDYAERLDVSGDFVRGLDAGISYEDAVEKIGEESARLRKLESETRQTESEDPDSAISGGRDASERAADLVEMALLEGATPGYHEKRNTELPNEARQMANLSFAGILREGLRMSGEDVSRLSKTQLSERVFAQRSGGAHSTSDYSLLLADVMNKRLQAEYREFHTPYAPLVSEIRVDDLKTVRSLKLGELNSVSEVPEGGEYPEATISEGQETYNIFKYGKIFSITEEAVINDDMRAFGQIPQRLAALFRRQENLVVFRALQGLDRNGSAFTMADSNALYHADHGNFIDTGSGGAISVTEVGDMKTLARKQSGLDADSSNLNLVPRYLVVPPAMETAAEQYLNGAFTPTAVGNAIPPSHRSLELIVAAELENGDLVNDHLHWYLVVPPSEMPGIEIARLRGQEGPSFAREDGFRRDGVSMKVSFRFGCGVVDHRGLYKNFGN